MVVIVPQRYILPIMILLVVLPFILYVLVVLQTVLVVVIVVWRPDRVVHHTQLVQDYLTSVLWVDLVVQLHGIRCQAVTTVI